VVAFGSQVTGMAGGGHTHHLYQKQRRKGTRERGATIKEGKGSSQKSRAKKGKDDSDRASTGKERGLQGKNGNGEEKQSNVRQAIRKTLNQSFKNRTKGKKKRSY